MSQTFRVDDGDLYVSDATGKAEIIEGRKKSAQDLARILLLEFNSIDNDGSEIINYTPGGSDAKFFSDSAVTQFIQTTVARLQVKQRQDPHATSQERILKILDLRTRTLEDGTYIFYLACQTEAGETVEEIINTDTRPVQLNHILPESTYSAS
jgi:hypothetical protein